MRQRVQEDLESEETFQERRKYILVSTLVFTLLDLILRISADHFVGDVDADLLGGIRIRCGRCTYL